MLLFVVIVLITTVGGIDGGDPRGDPTMGVNEMGVQVNDSILDAYNTGVCTFLFSLHNKIVYSLNNNCIYILCTFIGIFKLHNVWYYNFVGTLIFKYKLMVKCITAV